LLAVCGCVVHPHRGPSPSTRIGRCVFDRRLAGEGFGKDSTAVDGVRGIGHVNSGSTGLERLIGFHAPKDLENASLECLVAVFRLQHHRGTPKTARTDLSCDRLISSSSEWVRLIPMLLLSSPTPTSLNVASWSGDPDDGLNDLLGSVKGLRGTAIQIKRSS
jgi:hypothetical protein